MWAKIIATLTGQTVEAVLAYKGKKRQLKADIELEGEDVHCKQWMER